MSEQKDRYAFHLIALVYGESPADIARQLREHADAIDREVGTGHRYGPGGVCFLRQGDRDGCSEETFACRMHGVYHDSDYEPRPIAMFADAEVARRVAAGKPMYESDDDRPGGDLCVMRSDIVLSAWNSYDPDPHAEEAP